MALKFSITAWPAASTMCEKLNLGKLNNIKEKALLRNNNLIR